MKSSEVHPLEAFYESGLESLSLGNLESFVAENQYAADLKQRRIIEHLKVKQLFSQGSYALALAQIKKTRAAYGDHIGLLCDQAVLYYLTSQFSLWEQMVHQIDRFMDSPNLKLNAKTQAKTLFLQAKFYEEMGFIRRSLELLDKAEKIANAELIVRIRANKLRLLSLYSISNEFDDLYSQVKQSLSADLGFNTSSETIHSLLLAECCRYKVAGLESALARLEENDLADIDNSLILLDIALLLTQVEPELPESLLLKIFSLKPQNEFEKCLKKLLLKEDLEDGLWFRLSEKMPLGNFFSLAPLVEKTLADENLQIFKQQYDSLLKALPKRERKIWNRIPQHDDKILWRIDFECHRVIVDEKKIDFKSKKVLFELIQWLALKQTSSLESAVHELYQSEYNESYFHRMRRLVQRINDEFEKKALPKFIGCDKDSLEILKPYR